MARIHQFSEHPPMPVSFHDKAVELVSLEVEKFEFPPENFKVTIIWFAYFSEALKQWTPTPSTSWRCIAVVSDLPHSVFYEVSYDSVGDQHIVDFFNKVRRTTYPA